MSPPQGAEAQAGAQPALPQPPQEATAWWIRAREGWALGRREEGLLEEPQVSENQEGEGRRWGQNRDWKG